MEVVHSHRESHFDVGSTGWLIRSEKHNWRFVHNLNDLDIAIGADVPAQSDNISVKLHRWCLLAGRQEKLEHVHQIAALRKVYTPV